MVQVQWILGLVEEIEFANKSDVLPDYSIDITVRWKIPMTRIDVDKDEVFAVIKDSISQEYNDPNEEQQEAINLLDILSGFNPNPEVPVVAAAVHGNNAQKYLSHCRRDRGNLVLR